MEMRLFLDFVAVAGTLFSCAFWIASNSLYKDAINQIRENRKEMSMKNENDMMVVFGKLQKAIDRNTVRVGVCEARLQYLEGTKNDKKHSSFIEDIGTAFDSTDFEQK
ncbi:MAG: hypothetical protein QQW96_03720 [Tychonema bourrellyi B0820]|nr:hypothetical protein [Tychonema bourrellyi B0820]PJE45250.1 MAG: hypothetical protein CUR32_01220 [Flavobacterium sp.] [Flavobacterium sp. FEMGT703F]